MGDGSLCFPLRDSAPASRSQAVSARSRDD